MINHLYPAFRTKLRLYTWYVIGALSLVGLIFGADRVIMLGAIFCAVSGAYNAKFDLDMTPVGEWDIAELLDKP